MAAKKPVPPKAEPVELDVDGIKVTVDPESLDNIDLMEALGEIDSGNVFYIAKALRLMIGDQWARVKREMANDAGVTTASATAEFVGKMLTALSEANEQAKN